MVNDTTLTQSIKDWWNSPLGTVIHIEVLVVLAATIQLLLATFGSRRHQSRNFFIQKGVLGAYSLSSSLVSYILGSMQSSPVKSNMYCIWAMSLYVLSTCADSITAYSLDDHNQYTRQVYQFGLYHVYALMIMSSSVPNSPPPLIYLATVAHYKFQHRLLVHKLATVSWNLNKIVADYMYKEHIRSGSSYNAASMEGYHYLVDWPLHKSTLDAGTSYATLLTTDASQVIDIERIWLSNGRLLSPELKDACLSFSLFHLLRRRFFGFQCGESSHQKTHDFVFKGLLSKCVDGTTDYYRIFKVIDMELAFMYDFFFTKYAVLYYGSKSSTFWSLASASLISATAFCTFPVTMSSNQDKSNFLNTRTAHATTFFTVLILACVALLELLQLLLYWMTIWGRVTFVCQYVREQAVNTGGSYCMRFKEILTKIGVFASNKCYYRDKLGQFSLVESAKYDPSPFLAGVDVPSIRRYHRFLHLLDSSAFHHNMHTYARRVRKRHGKPIKLPAEVKRALVQSLERTDGKLTNGESSLLSNGAHQLLWACMHDIHSDLGTRCLQGMENQACFILTWHIATCYCEMATLKCLSPRVGGELKFNFDVATILSKYCAHLVVSVPKLLPGHHYDTSRVFDAVAAEAAQLLPGDKLEAMRSLPDESSQMSVFPKGVKLGKQLEEMEEGARWKVLADFWAELMLYVAPSDNVKEHIERLANGGEFITHLWALLTHAGILERGQRTNNVVDIENAGSYDQRPCPGEGSCGAAVRFRRANSCPLTSADKQAAPAIRSPASLINKQHMGAL